MSSKMLFLDSKDATKNYSESVLNELNNYHSYNICFNLINKLTNVKRIILKSVEMPIILNNIRNTNTSRIFECEFNDVDVNGFHIPLSFPLASSKKYTTISDLFTEVNVDRLWYGNQIIPGNILYSIVDNFYGIPICRISTTCAYLKLGNSILINDILGFAKDATTTNGILDGIKPVNLYPETFFYMHISNIPISNSNNAGFSTFKLPFNCTYNDYTGILKYEDFAEHQSINFPNNNFYLDKLNIILYDRWNFPVIGRAEWTMTLIIETYDLPPIQQSYYINQPQEAPEPDKTEYNIFSWN